MKITTGTLLIGMLLMIYGCTITDDGQVEDELEIESLGDSFSKRLMAVMASNLSQPTDRLVQVRFFNLAETDPTGYSNFYYDQQGKQVLSVGLNMNADTTRISLSEYDERGNRVRLINFRKRNGVIEWEVAQEYVFNSLDMEIATYNLSPDREKILLIEKSYDSIGRLIESRFGMEGYRYAYDENGRIGTESWIIYGNPDATFRELIYRYDDADRMIAREVAYGNQDDGPNLVPLYEYEYDKKGRLSQMKEFDTSFGISLRFTREYIYSRD
ncbi:MAG TPA: hypothetical protein VK957_04255 [Lunatimonas sp.]|nr:hypothetical protein [Lunatimonas sp.]